MTPKHTPGPWRAVYPPQLPAPEYVPIHIYGHDSDSPLRRAAEFNVCTVTSYSWLERKANARLIAAAPDLLEALENLENDAGQIPQFAWDMVQEAIAKAKGS